VNRIGCRTLATQSATPVPTAPDRLKLSKGLLRNLGSRITTPEGVAFEYEVLE
jgi:hypothetical protein